MTTRLRIASRPSALALAQTALVTARLAAALPGLKIEVVEVRTSGDRMAAASLAKVGGKGLFVKELEQALLERRTDLAVHSMKDLPAAVPAALRIAAVPARENPRDALVLAASGGASALAALPAGARLGTSSARRRFEALRIRPDLNVTPLRGNVDTRLKRLHGGELDGILLAIAGLRRLGRLSSLNFVELDENDFVPCAGQGALAIEALADGPAAGSREVEDAVANLSDVAATAETCAERAFLAAIGASCVSPVGAHATFAGPSLKLRALLFSLDGKHAMAGEMAGEITAGGDPRALAAKLRARAGGLGQRLGERMLSDGAAALLKAPGEPS